MRKCTAIICTLLITTALFSQSKYEKEERIKESAVPPAARAFVDGLGFDGKIKWFEETGLNRRSYEAKTKHRSKRYSVEFSIDGDIEDVEVTIDMKEINSDVRSNISQFCQNNFSKHRICKVQIQYTGSPLDLMKTVTSGQRTPDTTINYEIEVKVKKSSEFRLYEFLFDEEGTKLSELEIIENNTDHLEY